jgi:S-adenosylmethionine:tRNA ribosyltransferase-isomerase
MKLSDFDYHLPEERIAQEPLAERDASRLLLLERAVSQPADHLFRELPELLRGDELLVVNNARVIPARLFGRRRGLKSESPGNQGSATKRHLSSPIEVLLTRKLDGEVWEALVRPGRKVRVGERIVFGEGGLEAEIISRGEYGERRIKFVSGGDAIAEIERLGHMPLPPYIRRSDQPADRQRYQTIFASHNGAVAAPTAGLHFTSGILDRLRTRGIEICELTLEVGLGTFQPIREEEVERHPIHAESYEIPAKTAEQIRAAKKAGRPILAVGTTVVRALEDAARKADEGHSTATKSSALAGRGDATIYIYPGHKFRLVDQMLTNFHLPRSSLLVLVAAFAGRERILAAYQHAIETGYRFYSYGDCMLVR